MSHCVFMCVSGLFLRRLVFRKSFISKTPGNNNTIVIMASSAVRLGGAMTSSATQPSKAVASSQKIVRDICPALYKALRDLIGLVGEVREFSSPTVLANIEPWSPVVAWRLAAEETISLSSTIDDTESGDYNIISYALKGGKCPVLDSHRYRNFVLTYPLLSRALTLGNEVSSNGPHFPYWMVLMLNCCVDVDFSVLRLSTQPLNTHLKILSEVRNVEALKQLLVSLDKDAQKKLLRLTKANKNAQCTALLAQNRLVSIILKSVKDEEYFRMLLDQTNPSQRAVLSTHPTIVESPVALLFVVKDELKLWTYATCATIYHNQRQSFLALMDKFNNSLNDMPYPAFINALMRSKEPLFYVERLSDLLPLEAVLLASDLRVESKVIQILIDSLRRRSMLTAEIILELRMYGYPIV